LTAPSVAVITVVPALTPVASPALFIVPTTTVPLIQLTSLVITAVEPSL